MVIAFLKWNPFHHKLYKGNYEGGEYNGYVAFNKELPISWQGGGDYDDEEILDAKITVHGGITFDGTVEDMLETPIIPLTAIPDPNTLKNFRCVGFDTLHYNDTREFWTMERTKEETLYLMKQIEELCSR